MVGLGGIAKAPLIVFGFLRRRRINNSMVFVEIQTFLNFRGMGYGCGRSGGGFHLSGSSFSDSPYQIWS